MEVINTMQARLVQFIDKRTRLLTAMSQDLKTPITRMRLRTELLDNDNLREKFEKNLVEMETMVTQTLEFMRGLTHLEPKQPVDVMVCSKACKATTKRWADCRDRWARHAAFPSCAAAPQALHLQSGRQRDRLWPARRDPCRRRPVGTDHPRSRPSS